MYFNKADTTEPPQKFWNINLCLPWICDKHVVLKSNCDSHHNIPTANGLLVKQDQLSNDPISTFYPYAYLHFNITAPRRRPDWKKQVPNMRLENVLGMLWWMPLLYGEGIRGIGVADRDNGIGCHGYIRNLWCKDASHISSENCKLKQRLWCYN